MISKSDVFQISTGGFKSKDDVREFLENNGIDDVISSSTHRYNNEQVYPNFSISSQRKVNALIADINDLGFKYRARIRDIIDSIPKQTDSLKIGPIDQTAAFYFFVEHWDRPKGERIRLLPFLGISSKKYCLLLEDSEKGQSIAIEEIKPQRFFYPEDKFLVMVEDFKL